jgi:hypothetical protein
MPSAKVVAVLDDNVNLVASAADHGSTMWDLTAGYGGELHIKITNGATGPTLPAQAQVQVSPDNSHWYAFGGALVAGLGNDVVSSWNVPIPIGVAYAKVVSGSNTGQNVTIRIEGTQVTAI